MGCTGAKQVNTAAAGSHMLDSTASADKRKLLMKWKSRSLQLDRRMKTPMRTVVSFDAGPAKGNSTLGAGRPNDVEPAYSALTLRGALEVARIAFYGGARPNIIQSSQNGLYEVYLTRKNSDNSISFESVPRSDAKEAEGNISDEQYGSDRAETSVSPSRTMSATDEQTSPVVEIVANGGVAKSGRASYPAVSIRKSLHRIRSRFMRDTQSEGASVDSDDKRGGAGDFKKTAPRRKRSGGPTMLSAIITEHDSLFFDRMLLHYHYNNQLVNHTRYTPIPVDLNDSYE